jgi:hypothetical protein
MPNRISHGHDVVMIVAEGAPGKTILAMGCVHSLVADSARANRRHLKTATGRYIAGAAGHFRRSAKVADLLGRLRRTMSPR